MYMGGAHKPRKHLEVRGLEKSVLVFLHVDPEDQTQLIRLGGRPPYPLSHLEGQEEENLKMGSS